MAVSGVLDESYDPVTRRALNPNHVEPASRAPPAPKQRSMSVASAAAARRASGATRPVAPSGAAHPTPTSTASAPAPAPARVPSGDDSSVAALQRRLDHHAALMSQLEKERDFYFLKLRDIEMLCQALEHHQIPLVTHIEKIMYAADGAAGQKAMKDAEVSAGVGVGVGESESAREGGG